MFVKKCFVATASALLFFGLLAMKTFQANEKASSKALVVGLQCGYPPFEFMNADGLTVGFDLDVAACIAGKLEKTLVIKDMDFEGEILALKQGKIDLIISGMNITPSRLKEIAMVPYHGETATSLSLMFWNEIPAGISSIEDIEKLPDPSVSVESGAIPETYITRHKGIKAKSFQGALAPLLDVKYGKSVANLVEPDVAEYLQQKHPEIKVVDVPLPKDEAILGFGIGINHKNEQLISDVQQAVHELQSSGVLKQLEDKWFKGVQE